MRTGTVVACAALALGLPCLAQPAKTIRFDMHTEIQSNGDSRDTLKIIYPPAMYAEMRAKYKNPRVLARDFASSRSDSELVNQVATFDDAQSALVVTQSELGSMKNMGGGLWESRAEGEMAQEIDFAGQSVNAQGRAVLTFTMAKSMPEERLMKAKIEAVLPKGATQARWDDTRKAISYRLPFVGAGGVGRMSGEIRTRDKIMSGCYKAYGDPQTLPGQWLAKTVLKNVGTDKVSELRIRHRVQGYSEWSPWEKFPEVVPGQTVVSAYYPIFDKSVATLRSSTPAHVEVQWRHLGAGGKEIEDGDGARLTLMGVGEFIFGNLRAEEMLDTWEDHFNNTDLLAAWVTRDDPVTRDFAALANKIAGGVQAGVDDKSSVAAIQGIYELMLRNDITYQAPPGLPEKSSFDYRMVQNVKYPRDVIRAKSGTCIDLAILYAAAGHAIGLKPAVILIPGHAFPAFQMPEGGVLAVESTGVGGGSRTGSMTFEQAVESATKTFQEAQKSGQMIVIDFQSAWAKGISNPELEGLPPDILRTWGISEGGSTGRAGGAPPAAQAASSRPAAAGSSFVGNWSGRAVENTADGKISYDVNVLVQGGPTQFTGTFGGRFQMPTEAGPLDLLITGDGVSFKTENSGTVLVVAVKRLVRTLLATGERQVGEGNVYSLILRDGRLVGTDASGQVGIDLARR